MKASKASKASKGLLAPAAARPLRRGLAGDRMSFSASEGGKGPRAHAERVMRTLALQIDGMEPPAVEKISQAHAEDPFRILIGTILSARTQDATTHAASTRLFRAAHTPRTMAALSVKQIERLIYPVGFYRNKARFVKATCQALVTRYGGTVPCTLDELVTLPGVGRKTANLVMILAFQSRTSICVDTHVHRISNRMGWVTTRDPSETEQALYAATAQRWWPYINTYLVTWGQNVCRPVYPKCTTCALASDCPRIGVVKVANR
jgi:endonuclease III